MTGEVLNPNVTVFVRYASIFSTQRVKSNGSVPVEIVSHSSIDFRELSSIIIL